ncbi:MAG: hypothetical protein BGO37_16540 [Cellulomonas sp. 73-92]|uniref:hypothetical protein n=1 Tax=Cellulomonas sp. 73-92 TaxID=1895740 RepID=UPI0009272633|nr:hypothetical protein [Cellulomonas sp. 73-92]OJV81090.1 MAG: hypothetical protein BGO37_16540 [Cellulomonas sp. 73-92]
MADPTLEALVPRPSRRGGAALVVLALAVLVAAWVVPALVRPTIGTGSSAAGREFPAERRELVLAEITPGGWGGVTVNGVDDVPGAHVVGAWAVEGVSDALRTMPAVDVASDEYVTRLGVTDADRLPRRVAPGRSATLVVLWQIDSCRTAADGGAVSTPVHLRGPLGNARVETVPASPMLGGTEWSDGTPCVP